MKRKLQKNNPCHKLFLLAAIAALIFSAAVIALVMQHFLSHPGSIARIYQNGKLIREIDLSDKTADFSFTVTLDNGGYNTIRVSHGSIGVIDANCPDKICQNMGMISSTGYPVSCLPHKLLILIESKSGGNAAESLDAITR